MVKLFKSFHLEHTYDENGENIRRVILRAPLAELRRHSLYYKREENIPEKHREL